jgi:protocatechuate 3,4-dioxygenase beta subunit
MEGGLSDDDDAPAMSENDHHTSTLDGGHRAGGLTRRTAIGAAGAGGVALLFAGIKGTTSGKLLDALGPDVAEAAAGTCTLTAAKTVGPYFVEEKLNRSDVRANTSDGAVQAGVPLTLTLQVFDADNGCAPVKGATVDIWHANAGGLYSDESANGTSGQNWLRGYQTTDADGLVTFTTVYPGWYSGRTVHIHFKVRIYTGADETLEFTSQLFFTDAMNSSVFTSYSPYKDRAPKTGDTTDTTDGIYGSDGASLLLTPTASGSGFKADFSVGVSQTTSQLGNTSAGGPGGPGGPPATGDTTVSATLKATAMSRTVLGTRQLKLTIKTQEAVAATAKLTRGGKTVVTKTTTLATGTRTLKVTVPQGSKAGAAKLKLTLKDAAGNQKSYARTVHIRTPG